MAITTIEDLLKGDETFRYQMIARLQMDCDYYLGFGGRNTKRLWAQDEKTQISHMKALYNSFEVKPEWLSYEKILEYEKSMVLDQESDGNENVEN